MARKNDSRRHANEVRKQRKRRARRRAISSFAKFHGSVESLEARELLTGDTEVFEPAASADITDALQNPTEPIRGEGVAAAPPQVITALSSHLSSTGAQNFADGYKSLDVTGLTHDLLITVQKSNGNNNTISVQRMSAGSGTGGIATYGIESDGGSIDNLVVGRQGQKVRIILEGELDLLEVTRANDLQIAVAGRNTSSSLLTASTIVEVVQRTAGGIGTLEVGKSGDANDVELIIGADVHIDRLAKGTGFNGGLILNYPESTGSRLIKTIDLSTPTPYIQGFGQLQGFTAGSFAEVKTGSGRQELRVGDQTISLSGGSKDDVLLSEDDSQTLTGEAGNDFLRAGAGDDVLLGGDGNDQLEGGPGNDQLEGGGGDDTYFFGDTTASDGNAWGTADTISDTVGDNTVDFSEVAANLTVVINGNGLAVTASEEIDNDLPDGLSYGSDTDAVELDLSAGVVPEVEDFGEATERVVGGTLAFRMIVGSGRDQISVVAPTIQAIRDELGEESTVTRSANVTVRSSPGGARISAGDQLIAYQDAGGFWQQTGELLLRNLLPDFTRDAASESKSIDDATNVWLAPETTITLAVGEFRNQTNVEYEAASFDVTLFAEAPFAGGFTGSYTDFNAALRSYYREDLEPIIEAASVSDEISADVGRLNEIAEELWLHSIAEQIQTKFSTTNEVNAEVVRGDTGDVLSISIEGHVGDIAIAPTTVALPSSLASSFTQTQSLNGAVSVSRFVAPADNDAETTYDINGLLRDLTIDFAGDQPKSTLDVSDLDEEMRITFTGDGQLTVDVLGSTNQTITAAGISSLVAGGTSNRTWVLTEAGGASQFNVSDVSTGEHHLILGEGFLGKTIVLNNDDTDPFVIGSDSYPANDLEFEGGELAAPNFGNVVFDSLATEASFLGDLHVKGVSIVDSGKGDDRVEMTVATPAGQVVRTNDGNDTVIGSTDVDIVEAGDGDDTLEGNAGDDDLRGGKGNDHFLGGAGDDTLTGGKDDDTYAYESTGWGIDTIIETSGEGTQDAIEFSSSPRP